MSLEARITKAAERAIANRGFPGCVVGYIRNGQTNVLPFGRYTYEATSPAVVTDTIYDVASITKSIPTASLAAKLLEDGRLSLDDQVIKYLPEIQNEYREQMLVRHLLTYTVLFSTPPGFAKLAREYPRGLLEVLCKAPLRAKPGAQYQYTSPPTILLGLIVERVWGKPLDMIADEVFFKPLAMTRTTFHPEKFGREHIAPTELTWRGEIWGEPNDDAAWALNRDGLVPGHAGVFSTAGNLLRFGQMLLNGGKLDTAQYLRPETVQLMHTNQIADLGQRTGLGWMLNWEQTMGTAGSDQKFGMTGFTGCIILMDPVTKRAVVHLSNRTYPHVPADRLVIDAFRRDLANLIFED